METNTLAHIKNIKFDGYKIELITDIKGRPVARLSKLMHSGKNKGNYRLEEGYYFKSEERRKEWIEEKFLKIKERINLNNEASKKLKDVKDNLINPFKVGDIYFDSWGYEQTNIDFYEIVEVKEKSVMIQEIGSTMCEGGKESGMSSNVKPNPDKKVGDPILKIIQVRIWSGVTNIFIKSKHGWISKYTHGERGVYSSWYA